MSEEEKKGAYQALTELKRALITHAQDGSIYKSELITLLDDLRATYLVKDADT